MLMPQRVRVTRAQDDVKIKDEMRAILFIDYADAADVFTRRIILLMPTLFYADAPTDADADDASLMTIFSIIVTCAAITSPRV